MAEIVFHANHHGVCGSVSKLAKYSRDIQPEAITNYVYYCRVTGCQLSGNDVMFQKHTAPSHIQARSSFPREKYY